MPSQRTIPRKCEQCGEEFLAYAQQVKRGDGRYCGNSCRAKARQLFYLSEAWLVRFWSNIRKGDGCWEWQGARTTAGYGTILANGKNLLAHRVSYEIANGMHPGKMDVCHECDNPSCVRPDHLFLATHAENMKDMAKKARAGITSAIGPALADEIRARYAAGGILQRELAVEYGLSQPTISEILSSATWKHT